MATAWFIAIALLWALYLVLEGFDFGVGMLLRRVREGGGDQHDRRVAMHAIGPTWAANEVWLVIAVVGMFGAFPGWYAAWASGLYLPLSVVLLALIARNASIELLGKRDDEAWRRGWERVLAVSSTVAPFCWGLIWGAALDGVALRGSSAVGGPLDVFSWYAVLCGVALVALCRALGAAFLALRTTDLVRARAARELRVSAPAAALLGGSVLVWTDGLGRRRVGRLRAVRGGARRAGVRPPPSGSGRSRAGAPRSGCWSRCGSPRCSRRGSGRAAAGRGSSFPMSPQATTRSC